MIRSLLPATIARETSAIVVETLTFHLMGSLWASYARSYQARAAMRP